jgi:plasmid replication initiation protein
MASSLLPERHPVKDFFVLDVLDVVPRSDMASMEHPIFSLCTKPDSRVLTYVNGDVQLSIRPSLDGLPTVFDKDILIYCISKLVHMKNAGCPIGPAVRLTTHDMLVQTNRPTNNLGYERLLPALRRLKGTTIETTVATGDEVTTKGFGLIDEFEYNRKGSMHAERLRFLEVRLSDWLFRAIDSCEVLPINRRYFRLRRPIDRRLYELARKHCGQQPTWRVGFDLLQRKCNRSRRISILPRICASLRRATTCRTTSCDWTSSMPCSRGGTPQRPRKRRNCSGPPPLPCPRQRRLKPTPGGARSRSRKEPWSS